MATKTATNNSDARDVVPAAPGAVAPVQLNKTMATLARAIDEVAFSHTAAIREAKGHMERAFLMGGAITALRKAITGEVLEAVMPLMGSPNGFKCDRPNKSQGPYAPEQVKECLITSLLLGLYPVNNEWNIISGQCYPALNGYKRLFESVDGITDIAVTPGTPRFDGNVALCRVAISWKLRGQPNRLTDPDGKPGPVFTVQISGPSTADAVIGKAKRKAYKAAFEKATGSVCTEGDEDLDSPAALPAPANGTAARVLERLPEPARQAAPTPEDLEAEDARRRAAEGGDGP